MILLPPSEGKAIGGSGPAWPAATIGASSAAGSMVAGDLDARRLQVAAALGRAMKRSKAARGKLLGVKGEALTAATATNLEVLTGPTRPAIERYTGVLYGALDAASLPAAHRRRLATQVRILSGLWGVVGPADPIPDYKLKMGASLAPLGKLSTWWRPMVTAVLAPEVAGRVVWNLLPNEHAAAWAPAPVAGGDPSDGAARTVISVRFLDQVVRAGRVELVAVSHWNKLLKGALVRHVLATQLAEPAGLADFTHSLGYRYVPDLTVSHDDGIGVTVSLVKPRTG